jgi:hypothetical protein
MIDYILISVAILAFLVIYKFIKKIRREYRLNKIIETTILHRSKALADDVSKNRAFIKELKRDKTITK